MKSLAASLTALTLVCAAARAQDAPPADLLSHVKVGQTYTFTTTVGQMVNEELWQVAEVHPDRVLYRTTTRVRQGERQLVEKVGQELVEWTWGGRPVQDAATLARMKGTQTRQTLEVPGLRLDCLVTTAAGAESWTAVKGDLETFPAMVKAASRGAVVRVLTKVEEGAAPSMPEAAPAEPVDEGSGLPAGALDHVKVGQRWVFANELGAIRVENIWTVTEVVAAEGRVRYTARERTIGQGKTTESEESAEEWTSGDSPVREAGTTVAGVTTERKVLELGALKLDCYVVNTRMGGMVTEVWTAVRGDREVFPGHVKQLIGARGGRQLVRVEE